MTNEQQSIIFCHATVVKANLQCIEQGQHPDAHTLEERRRYAAWQLEYLLEHVVEALPLPLREEVQACLDLNQRLWSSAYSAAYFQAQQKASPLCLPTEDPLEVVQ